MSLVFHCSNNFLLVFSLKSISSFKWAPRVLRYINIAVKLSSQHIKTIFSWFLNLFLQKWAILMADLAPAFVNTQYFEHKIHLATNGLFISIYLAVYCLKSIEGNIQNFVQKKGGDDEFKWNEKGGRK